MWFHRPELVRRLLKVKISMNLPLWQRRTWGIGFWTTSHRLPWRWLRGQIDLHVWGHGPLRLRCNEIPENPDEGHLVRQECRTWQPAWQMNFRQEEPCLSSMRIRIFRIESWIPSSSCPTCWNPGCWTSFLRWGSLWTNDRWPRMANLPLRLPYGCISTMWCIMCRSVLADLSVLRIV